MRNLLTIEDINTIVWALEDMIVKEEEHTGKINKKIERIQSVIGNLTLDTKIDLSEYDEPTSLCNIRFKIERL